PAPVRPGARDGFRVRAHEVNLLRLLPCRSGGCDSSCKRVFGRLCYRKAWPEVRISTRYDEGTKLDFTLDADLTAYLQELDEFIEREIKPLQAQDDNERFFDHRREWARTDFDNGGLPRPEWAALLREARRRA